MSVFTFIASRFKEPSTMAGIALVADAVHTAAASGGSGAAFYAAGVAIVPGLLAIVMPEVSKAAEASPQIAAPVAKVSDQVAEMAAEVAKIASAVSGVAVAK